MKKKYMSKKYVLTDRQQKALDYLKKYRGYFICPTTIGRLFGGHSAIGSPICKRLVEFGLVERNNKGCYRIKE